MVKVSFKEQVQLSSGGDVKRTEELAVAANTGTCTIIDLPNTTKNPKGCTLYSLCFQGPPELHIWLDDFLSNDAHHCNQVSKIRETRW